MSADYFWYLAHKLLPESRASLAGVCSAVSGSNLPVGGCSPSPSPSLDGGGGWRGNILCSLGQAGAAAPIR